MSTPAAEQSVQAVLENPQHPAYATMWKAVTDRAYGKPTQAVEVTGKNGGPLEVDGPAVRQRVAARLARRIAAVAAAAAGNAA